MHWITHNCAAPTHERTNREISTSKLHTMKHESITPTDARMSCFSATRAGRDLTRERKKSHAHPNGVSKWVWGSTNRAIGNPVPTNVMLMQGPYSKLITTCTLRGVAREQYQRVHIFSSKDSTPSTTSDINTFGIHGTWQSLRRKENKKKHPHPRTEHMSKPFSSSYVDGNKSPAH